MTCMKSRGDVVDSSSRFPLTKGTATRLQLDVKIERIQSQELQDQKVSPVVVIWNTSLRPGAS